MHLLLQRGEVVADLEVAGRQLGAELQDLDVQLLVLADIIARRVGVPVELYFVPSDVSADEAPTATVDAFELSLAA